MSNSNFTDSMFNSIKSSLTKEDKPNAAFKDILKLEKDKTYTVRLLPNIKDPSKTFFHYYTFDWKCFNTGKYTSVVSPSTWDQRDPIAEERFRIHKHGTEEEKAKSQHVRRVERWLVNIFVVNDPVTPENNGTIKVLRFGKQLHKIIMEAIEGEEAEEYGARIFDLSEKGCNFKIKVEEQGEYASYTASKFTTPRAVEGLDPDAIDETYTKINDLNKYVTIKTYEEVKEVWNKHYLIDNEGSTSVETKTTESKLVETKAVIPVVPETVSDKEIDDLLKDL